MYASTKKINKIGALIYATIKVRQVRRMVRLTNEEVFFSYIELL